MGSKVFFFFCGIDLALIGFLSDYSSDSSFVFALILSAISEIAELGYVISPKYKGNGYCTEALEKSIDYLLASGYNQVICGAFEHNLASIRVMQKAGMKKMTKTDDIEYRGQVHKCVYYCTVL